MLQVHGGYRADGEFKQRFVACFVAAADDVNLPDDVKLRALAPLLGVGSPTEDVPSSAEVPHGQGRWSGYGWYSSRMGGAESVAVGPLTQQPLEVGQLMAASCSLPGTPPSTRYAAPEMDSASGRVSC